MINNDIIKILVCPDCSSKIEYKNNNLYCVGCHREFKFHENILDLRPKELGYEQVLADQSFSKDYKELMNKKLEIYEDEYSKADMELININDPLDKTFVFLEIGCGRGRVSNAISRKYNDYKNFQTIGICTDASSVRALASKLKVGSTVIVAGAIKIQTGNPFLRPGPNVITLFRNTAVTE